MTKAKSPYDTVVVSGGFDPVHIGHVRLILAAAEYGDVIVVANSDSWLYRKKGFVFMTWEQRKEILEALKGVVRVEWVDDTDETVCEALRRIKPTYFANGGDRKGDNVPEVAVCEELDIEMLWNMGGTKIESSSDLVNKANRAGASDNGYGSGKHSDK
jgi:D-beta-D-heptose 7-phosphate kinase/D-beta-D-heptose 1-phosphate adenosyltransferase